MSTMTTRTWVFPPDGTRIRLVSMPNDPDPVPVGSEGTVIGHSTALSGQLWVAWDNGRSLCLLPGTDVWEVIR